jgi:HK97 family phage major capsid protein
MGTRPLPLNNGNMTIPRLKGGAVVGYIGSDSDVPATQGEFDDLKLSGKKLAALVPISNDLLANSSANECGRHRGGRPDQCAGGSRR